jgi:LacI family transcriptional regulator
VECSLSFPPLSSVAVPSQQIGYAAAELLDRMMAGKSVPREPIFLPPVRVVTRQSTDTLAIADAAVAEALSFIRRRAAEPINVGSVVKSVAQGRRPLERKFRMLLGRTILQEIRRVRVERVKELLVSTNLSMPKIAADAGFANAARLCVVFRQLTGLTPSQYRHRSVLRERG